MVEMPFSGCIDFYILSFKIEYYFTLNFAAAIVTIKSPKCRRSTLRLSLAPF